ncbi:hypothetical protein L207DRAFT_571771 [Hyaloscypha variabilis F]|uniref:C2H2-type domain-containing protein n=1 Tax=Hyaloscypha variabilis (strain UAMH 11265 / GT02V1 / F) TaxID=1149755 RepID=A0A2J6R3B6_HYAVF|nr:hypothetical protein L207DRAFT_571771 [Hyaloscypha variabilis F]
MAKPNKRQAKPGQKIKCEYYDCTTTFARDADRLRHRREKHGPGLCCSYPGCDFTTKRRSRLGDHLKSTHHRQVTFNLAIPSEFHNTNTQTLASSNHHLVSALDPNTISNFNFNLDPTTPLPSTDYTTSLQAATPSVFKRPTALPSSGPSTSISSHTYTYPAGLLATARARTQPLQRRIFKPCRVVRRRKPRCGTQHTSFPPPPPPSPSPHHLDTAMTDAETPPAFSSSSSGQEKEDPDVVLQWMVVPQNQHTLTFDPELSCVDVLDSLSLLDSMRGFEAEVEVEVEVEVEDEELLMDEEYEREED